MKKTFVFVVASICIFFSSCATLESFTKVDNSVAITESAEEVNKKASRMLKNYSYIISIFACDRFDNNYKIIILDEQYLCLNGKVYAYKFDSLMRRQIGYTKPDGTFVPLQKQGGVVGFTGYATSVDNPENTISFILSRFIVTADNYTSGFDARQKDKGIYFTGLPKYSKRTKNGELQRATYFDYFPILFYTDDYDVQKRNLRKMYIVIKQQ